MALTALPPAADARAFVAQRVHVAAFLDKLAALRPQYMPQTQQQLQELLALGEELQEDELAKTASAVNDSPFTLALQGLRAARGKGTVEGMSKAASIEQKRVRLTKIATALAADPHIHAAATSILANQAA